MAKPLISERAPALAGSARVPGDKSISHRALMLGALAVGESVVTGLLEGDDVLRTAACMRALGAEVTRLPDGSWRLFGRGIGGLVEPADVLDMGNSGTGARLLMGLVATHPFTSVFTGDSSLRSRPMRRISDPLSRMGARFHGRDGGRLPMAVIGTDRPVPIVYELPVASAQVKSAILLAGLNTPGETTVIEREATRDHTELMLRNFGAAIRTEAAEGGGLAITVTGFPELTGRLVAVPADPSSAAFPAVAALLVEGSEIRLPGIGVNPLRAGLYQTLLEMGADIAFENRRDQAGEPVADLVVRSSRLKGIAVPAERAPSMIDEYPILAVAAAFAEGTTRMNGLGELRVKESDRLAAMAKGLAACGVAVEEEKDALIVHGTGRPPAGGGAVATHFDHRIAMSFLVMGMASEQPVRVDDAEAIDTSFPGFADLMNGLGARIGAA
ncbi:3-phosphoshikimate 1-carboxyvinyltransferase [Magnetospirillum sp. SS-4]|uniref:3-phosphoshikimate 1-carboxyvinyltransferase n=1 Tax=Magnetospirillum sp. SS-4 TaxID=2681465 RepID=UPI0013814FAB|nr:3-phosphoshikimate 1-carboxyvinyltransferase [Magnetospirillum sp. SS-4]CAA7615811.1 3-phosphoshikimate 1-carboxyvinyltransferase [Magnetospirillum sp. SS-4]